MTNERQNVRTIKNFQDFEDRINEFKSKFNESITAQPVFRGVQETFGDAKYLSPSIAWRNLVKYEKELISEMRRLKPLQFNNIAGLDLIAKLRHYGLPTRLLDFSLSPYMALYFATCDSERFESATSKVYCTAANINDTMAETIALISGKMQPYMYSDSNKKIFIEDVLFQKQENNQQLQSIREFLNTVHKNNVFLNPKFYSEREIRQQSVFMIFCNDIVDTYGEINFEQANWEKTLAAVEDRRLGNRFKFQDTLYNSFTKCSQHEFFDEIIIEQSAIGEIRDKLNGLGINASMLFPDDLEKTAKYVVENLQNKYKLN